MGQLRWGISYTVLLWALAVAAPQPAAATPKITVLHNFTGETDGAYPIGRPTKNGKGGFYGLTSQGGYPGACGKKGCGVVYELTPPKAGERPGPRP